MNKHTNLPVHKLGGIGFLPREIAVMRAVAVGANSKHIAFVLGQSKTTVERWILDARRKLKNDRLDTLVKFAVKNNLVTLSQ